MVSLSPMVIIAILSAIILVLSAWLFMVERRLRKLLSGKSAQSLEGVIGALGEDIRVLEKFRDDTSAYLKTADARIRRSIQSVETIRFNAFKGVGEGGNQSFAIAILSEEGNGTVVSSLYSRDRMSVFAKPIKHFASEHGMTDEERDVIARAKHL